jgi:hypothetical protein
LRDELLAIPFIDLSKIHNLAIALEQKATADKSFKTARAAFYDEHLDKLDDSPERLTAVVDFTWTMTAIRRIRESKEN